MRRILLCLISVLLLSAVLKAEDGYVLEYSVEGEMIGGTSLMGNLKVVLIPEMKKLEGNMFIEEPGNPYPDLQEKQIIVDLKSKQKYLYTSNDDEWLPSSLSEEYGMIPDNSVKIDMTKGTEEIFFTINVTQPPEFGGNIRYTVKLYYNDPKAGGEIKGFPPTGTPSAVDFLSMYLDNEKFTVLMNSKLGDKKFQIPDSFEIKSEQAGEVLLYLKGENRAVINMNIRDSAFGM